MNTQLAIEDVARAIPDLHCHVISEMSHSGAYFDRDGHAKAAYAANGLFLIRPDNYMAMAVETPDAAEIVSYLRRMSVEASRTADAASQIMSEKL